MKITEIRSESELDGLRAAWNELLNKAYRPSIFSSWEWTRAWWSAYGKPGQLRILLAFGSEGELLGIAPLRWQKLRRCGQTVAALSFIGDGSNDSDYMDFVIANGSEGPVVQAFLEHWSEELSRGTVLALNEIPEHSPAAARLLEIAASQKHSIASLDVPCSTVSLPKTWEEYLHGLRPRFRTKVRSVLRSLETRPEVRFGFCATADDGRRLLPILFDLHTKRWEQDGKSGVFGGQDKRDFYAELSPLLLENRWLRFSWLEWNGQVLALQYGFAYGQTYYQLQEGYEPAAEHWNLGLGLRAWTIRAFIEEGINEYDFLGGTSRNKNDWGSHAKLSKKLTIAASSRHNVLFCRGPELETKLRESLGKVTPERVMAMRRRWYERRSAKRPAARASANELNWIQGKVANSYLGLRLPALSRRVRNRYQLEKRTFSWSPFRLKKRTEPSARILYYHRVNDDNDPFYPALPTKVFDEHMRFVARHYKVVGLGELGAQLANGSPEPLLGITFDDGYEDNFEHAFPILEKYGLPATIFLTTGCMDSREPLWFEKLAEAIKKTEREFIDLEIDIPRRMWMRTREERLDSNRRIFLLLRALPDAQRQVWLTDIHKLLGGGGDSERKSKMLTWEQARTMQGRGIDFGGHTVTHPFLSKLTQEQVSWEVRECKRRIEEELQTPVRHFSYPNGREEDFGKWNKDVIRQAGYSAAVTTIWGMNYGDTDPLELRRGGPWEENLAHFAYKLDWYQLVND